jgi:HEAT repeat protein
MSAPIQCPKCGQQYALKAEMAGKWVQCKKCGVQFQAPGPAAPASPQPAVPAQPVPAIPVQARPAVPAQAVPAIPVPAHPAAPAPGVPVNPALGAPVIAPRRRYRQSGFSKAISHPMVILGIIVLVVGGLTGLGIYFAGDIAKLFAGKPIPGDEAVRGYIDLFNALADALAEIRDPQSAMSAMPRFQALQDRERELHPKVAEFNQATPEQREHLRKKYETRLKEAIGRVEKEVNRILALQGFGPRTYRPPMLAPKQYSWDGPLAGIFGEEQKPEPSPGTTDPRPQDKTARVEIVGVPAGQRNFVDERLREASAEARVSLDATGGDVVSASVTPVADLDAFAARINLGTPKVDASKRTITVQADLEKFPKPMAPEAKNPAHAGFYKANLAELACPDGARRREAADRLKGVEPKELHEEIAKALLPLMSDNAPQTRRAGAEAWAVWRTPATAAEGSRLLLALAREQDHQLRSAAFKALGELKDPQTAEPLARMLSDFSLRGPASECLESMGPAAQKAILPLLTSSDHSMRSAAREVFEKIATKDSVPALVELLAQKKGDFAQCREILQVLAKLKDERALAPMAQLLGDRQAGHAVKEFFIQMGRPAEKVMVESLQDPKEEVATDAMEVLEKIGTPECLPAVLEAVKGENHRVRWAGFRLLERLKDPKSVLPLAEMLAEPSLRHSAGQVLRKIGPAAEDVVLKGLKHPDRQVGMTCLEILKDVGTEKSFKELKPLTRVKDFSVRRQATETLNAIAMRTQGSPFSAPEDEEK